MAKNNKATALDHLRQLAEKCSQEISLLASLVVGAVEAEFLTASIPTNAWRANTDAEKKAVGLAYMADVAVEGAEAKDGVEAVLPVGSQSTASAAGMANVATVVPGAVRFYAVTVPEAAVAVQVRIIQGK